MVQPFGHRSKRPKAVSYAESEKGRVRDCKAQTLLFGGLAFLTDRERKNKGLTIKSLFFLLENLSRNGRIEASIPPIFEIGFPNNSRGVLADAEYRTYTWKHRGSIARRSCSQTDPPPTQQPRNPPRPNTQDLTTGQPDHVSR